MIQVTDRVAAFINGRFVGIGSVVLINRALTYSHEVNLDDGCIERYQEEELSPVKRYRGNVCQN